MNDPRGNLPIAMSGQRVTIDGDTEVLTVVHDVYPPGHFTQPCLALLRRSDGSTFECTVEVLQPFYALAKTKTTVEDRPRTTISGRSDPQSVEKVDEPQLGRSVSIDAAATLLMVSRRTIYNRIATGRLQTIRTLGGSQRVLVSSMPVVRGPNSPFRLARRAE